MKSGKLLIVLSILGLAATALCQDQEPQPPAPLPDAKMKPRHQAMDMKSMDEQLDKLMIDMNTATTPEKKLDAAIAVINELVAQHKRMHQKAIQHFQAPTAPMPGSQKPQ